VHNTSTRDQESCNGLQVCKTWTMVLGASLVVMQPNRSGGGFDPDGLIAYGLIFSELMDGNREVFIAAYKQC